MKDWPQFLHAIDAIAGFVADDRENIIEFIREDRIPYIVVPDGILIPLGGFQACMNELYDLAGYLEEIDKKIRESGDNPDV